MLMIMSSAFRGKFNKPEKILSYYYIHRILIYKSLMKVDCISSYLLLDASTNFHETYTIHSTD
ncbi:hypothetical protein C0J52_16899, partial [Blattella germanica]